jgi:hypothetical protein
VTPHPEALVHLPTVAGAVAAAGGALVAVVDATSITPAGAGLAAVITVAISALSYVIKAQAAELAAMRQRIAELEARGDGERGRLIDRIDELERRLRLDEGDGR